MKDFFICPKCNSTTQFEGAPKNIRVIAREIKCKCKQRYVIIVNYGCIVQAIRFVPKNEPKSQ